MAHPHNIDIHIDGKFHGSRLWQNVPRVGECVAVKIGGLRMLAMVEQVVWGNLSDDISSMRPNCHIDLFCKMPEGF